MFRGWGKIMRRYDKNGANCKLRVCKLYPHQNSAFFIYMIIKWLKSYQQGVENFFEKFFHKKWGIVGNLCIFAHYLLVGIKKRLKISIN